MEESVQTEALTEPMVGLVRAVRRVVSEQTEPARVAERVAGELASRLDDPNLLRPVQRAASESSYRQHVLHVEEDGSFSVVSLVWLPGQSTPVHDHVAWCVTGVHRGRELEQRFRHVPAQGDEGAYLVKADRTTNETGSVAALSPPGDIHRVENPGPETAVSLHVYGADIGALGSSIRRRYDLEVRPA